MASNPCPVCGRDRGTSQTLMGVDSTGNHVLSPEYPSPLCIPCYEGIPIDAEWPRRLKPEYEGLGTTACGFARLSDGSLVPPDEMYL